MKGGEQDCSLRLQGGGRARSFIYIGMAELEQAAVYLAVQCISTATLAEGTALEEQERHQAQPLTREALALAVARAVAVEPVA